MGTCIWRQRWQSVIFLSFLRFLSSHVLTASGKGQVWSFPTQKLTFLAFCTVSLCHDGGGLAQVPLRKPQSFPGGPEGAGRQTLGGAVLLCCPTVLLSLYGWAAKSKLSLFLSLPLALQREPCQRNYAGITCPQPPRPQGILLHHQGLFGPRRRPWQRVRKQALGFGGLAWLGGKALGGFSVYPVSVLGARDSCTLQSFPCTPLETLLCVSLPFFPKGDLPSSFPFNSFRSCLPTQPGTALHCSLLVRSCQHLPKPQVVLC